LGIDPFVGIDGYGDVSDLEPDLDYNELKRWTQHLRRFNVFFSEPLDLDMSLLCRYFDYYSTDLDDGAKGPDLVSDPIAAVLGSVEPVNDYWKAPERRRYLSWYRYLFANKSKPASHLRALTTIPDDQLSQPPSALADLIDNIEKEVGLG
jgi:putative ATP-dependent endonuclease of OLD family